MNSNPLSNLNPELVVTTISQQEWENESSELDQKMAEACRLGFFYLEIPQDCIQFIPAATQFSHSFYKDERTKNLKLPDFCGYNDRPWQAESLFLEPKDWEEHLPHEVNRLAKSMNDLSLQISKKILGFCGFSEKDWSLVSGGLTEDKGWVHLSVNHYRPEKEGIGMEEHKDMGQVTVLFFNQEGLEVMHQKKWTSVPPKENHFLINFGQALEVLVNDRDRLVAVLHRVRHVADRISFALFAENAPDSYLCERTTTGEIVQKELYRDYITKLLAPTLL